MLIEIVNNMPKPLVDYWIENSANQLIAYNPMQKDSTLGWILLSKQ